MQVANNPSETNNIIKNGNYLYYGRTKLNIKQSICKGLCDGFQINMNFEEYRQICSLILHQHFSNTPGFDETENALDSADIHHLQAGHTKATALAKYGFANNTSTGATPKISFDDVYTARVTRCSPHVV